MPAKMHITKKSTEYQRGNKEMIQLSNQMATLMPRPISLILPTMATIKTLTFNVVDHGYS